MESDWKKGKELFLKVTISPFQPPYQFHLPLFERPPIGSAFLIIPTLRCWPGFFFFFFYMFTQEGKKGFELVTFTLLGVVPTD
jgi:hypothetical protein